jgi:hypothetical protein
MTKSKLKRLTRLTLSLQGWVIAFALLMSQTSVLNGKVLAMELIQSRTQIRTAFERGYVAGYADGYMAGKNDYTGRFSRNFQQHLLYQEADRGYQSRYGLFADYQNGYRLGFEVAYFDGIGEID